MEELFNKLFSKPNFWSFNIFYSNFEQILFITYTKMSSTQLNFSVERILLHDLPISNANSGHQNQQQRGMVHHPITTNVGPLTPPPILLNLNSSPMAIGLLLDSWAMGLAAAAMANKKGIDDKGKIIMEGEGNQREKKVRKSGFGY